MRQIDVGRTLLDLSGLGEAPFPGFNLADSLEEYEPARQPRFAISSRAISASINTGRWHLILHLAEHGGGLHPRVRHTAELYDLVNDPETTRDLSEEEPERTRAMRRALIQWLGNASPEALGGAAAADGRMLEHLSALGYATSSSGVSREALFDPDCDCKACRYYR